MAVTINGSHIQFTDTVTSAEQIANEIDALGDDGVVIKQEGSGTGGASSFIIDTGDLGLRFSGDTTLDGDFISVTTHRARNNTGNSSGVRVDGTLRLGVEQVVNGVTRRSGGAPLRSIGSEGGNVNLIVNNGGNLIGRGGRIDVNGMVFFDAGAAADMIENTFYQLRALAGQQFRVSGNDAQSQLLEFRRVVLDGATHGWSIFTVSSIGVPDFVPRRGEYLNFVNNQPELTFPNWNNAGNVNVADYVPRKSAENGMQPTNFDNCSREIVNQSQSNGVNGWGRTRKQISIHPVDVDGAEISQFSYYGDDTGRGNRNHTVGGSELTENDDKVYSASDAVAPVDITVVGSIYTGVEINTGDSLQVFDQRYDENGEQIIKVGSYGTVPVDVAVPIFGASEKLNLRPTLLPDSSLAELDRSVIEAIDIVATAAELNDLDHLWGIVNLDGGAPFRATKIGRLVDFGDLFVDVNPNHALPYDVVDGVALVRANALDADIRTTEEVTGVDFVNGSVIDINGDSDGIVTTPAGFNDILAYLSPDHFGDESLVVAEITAGELFRYNSSDFGGVELFFQMFTDSGLSAEGSYVVPEGPSQIRFPLLVTNENAALGNIELAVARLEDSLTSVQEDTVAIRASGGSGGTSSGAAPFVFK